MIKYFSSEKQDTEGEDCWHLNDGEQLLVGFHNTVGLLMDSPLSSTLLVFLFDDGYQGCGHQKHHSPKEQEVCSKRTKQCRNTLHATESVQTLCSC